MSDEIVENLVDEIKTYAGYFSNGRIKIKFQSQESLASHNAQLNGVDSFIEVEPFTDIMQYYVSNETLVLRPPTSIRLEGNILKNVKAGSKFEINWQPYEPDGTDIELEFEYPGSYKIDAENFPELPFKETYIETQTH